MRFSFVIEGEAASKANSRRLVIREGRVRFIKSPEALAFERACILQIPARARVMYAEPVCITLWMFYRNERRDLDESVLLDCLQPRAGRRGVILNDRQVREKHVYHGIDAKRPRVEVLIEALT